MALGDTVPYNRSEVLDERLHKPRKKSFQVSSFNAGLLRSTVNTSWLTTSKEMGNPLAGTVMIIPHEETNATRPGVARRSREDGPKWEDIRAYSLGVYDGWRRRVTSLLDFAVTLMNP
jgi:hypothetical protein